ncbi:MAG: GNAT family N-acetyltransferase [Propionibacteriaceae bacterium]|nr:GNAT family N-acetyltransferase [Propionibacteriaceae bacterium]
MEDATRARITGHWTMRFGTPVPGLVPVTLASTGRYADAALVLLLGGQAWVDAPVVHLDAVSALVRGRTPDALGDPELWAGMADGPVRGPADHYWADHTTDLPPGAGPVEPGRLVELRAAVTAQEWAEAGFDTAGGDAFGIEEDGRLVAAAVVNPLWGWRADVGVLVAPGARGRGLGATVAAAALASGVAQSGFAVFRAALANDASQGLARRLGLERHGVNLLVPLAAA